MAGNPKERALVPCSCQHCNGAMIDPVIWLEHNGITRSNMAEQPDRMFYMGEWWKKEITGEH